MESCVSSGQYWYNFKDSLRKKQGGALWAFPHAVIQFQAGTEERQSADSNVLFALIAVVVIVAAIIVVVIVVPCGVVRMMR